jgi:hypothetical protein
MISQPMTELNNQFNNPSKIITDLIQNQKQFDERQDFNPVKTVLTADGAYSPGVDV